MKYIIVPFDFSDEAKNGIALAKELAQDGPATIQLVYVQPKEPDFGHVGLLDEQRIAEREFQRLVEDVKEGLSENVSVEFVIRKGKVYSEIVDQANQYEDSMIVTSTHGASGVEEFFIGSNTLRILAATAKPVFTIRHGVVPQKFTNIIFPLDTSFESRQKAPFAARLAKEWNAKVHILAVAKSTNDAVANRLSEYAVQMDQYFTEHNVEHSMLLVGGEDLVEESLAQAMLLSGSMIIIASRDRNTLRIFMIGEKAQQLIRESPVPVLVIAPNVEPIRDSFKTLG